MTDHIDRHTTRCPACGKYVAPDAEDTYFVPDPDEEGFVKACCNKACSDDLDARATLKGAA